MALSTEHFHQLAFEGVAAPTPEVAFDNLVVQRPPSFRKSEDGYEWSCAVSYQRDLWHQENYEDFLLHATQNTDAALKLRLKPHDLIQVRGIPWTQDVPLRGGKTRTVHHLTVLDIALVRRAPRFPAVRRGA